MKIVQREIGIKPMRSGAFLPENTPDETSTRRRVDQKNRQRIRTTTRSRKKHGRSV